MAHGGLSRTRPRWPRWAAADSSQNPAPQARVVLLVTAAGKGRRIGASGDPHRAGGEDHDGPRGGIAAPPRLKASAGASTDSSPAASTASAVVWNRVSPSVMQAVPAAMLRAVDGARPQKSGAFPPPSWPPSGDATHLGVVVQIHAPGRLGKALVQHPLALDAQGLRLPLPQRTAARPDRSLPPV